MTRLGLISACCALLAGCASNPSPAPRPASAASKDARTVLLVTDERSRELAPGPRGVQLSVYQQARAVVAGGTQGLLRLADDHTARAVFERAGVPPQRSGPSGSDLLGLRSAQIPAVLGPAASQGVDYLMVVHDWSSHTREYKHNKDDRLKLVGSLGISYTVETTGYETRQALEVTVWHCKSGRELFRRTFEATDGGGAREKRDLTAWLGLALVQQLMPESTGTERNPVAGDYVLNVSVPGWIKLAARHPPTSGILAHSLLIPVVRVVRQGEVVQLTVKVENRFDGPLEVRFAQAFCLDRNGARYASLDPGSVRRTLPPDTVHEFAWRFRVSDRNVEFLNLHLKAEAEFADFAADADLQWKNILLQPLGEPASASIPPPAPKPRRRGSGWQMQDVAGQIYSAESCRGRPVAVFYCDHALLADTGLFSEAVMVGVAASRVGALFKEMKDRGFIFLWIDDRAGVDPAGMRKIAAKFGLHMPVITPNEEFDWRLPISGQPWLAILRADGQVHRTGRDAMSKLMAGELAEELRSLPVSENASMGVVNFGLDPLLKEVCGGANLKSFPSVKEVFRGSAEAVRRAVEAEAKATGGIWRTDPAGEWIHTKSYIYAGYWNLLAASKVCRHVVALQREGNEMIVEVVTPMWRHDVDVVDEKTGQMRQQHREYPDYNQPGSERLSRKFLDGVKKRLR